MELVVFVEPQQGWTYDDLLRVALAAESHGFDGFFRSEHFLRMDAETAPPGSTDAWATLAGLARETERIRLGTLLSAATFRLPGPLASGSGGGGIAGTPDEAVAALARYAAIGVSRVYLQVLDLADLAQLALVGREVLPRARGIHPEPRLAPATQDTVN